MSRIIAASLTCSRGASGDQVRIRNRASVSSAMASDALRIAIGALTLSRTATPRVDVTAARSAMKHSQGADALDTRRGGWHLTLPSPQPCFRAGRALLA